jgi:hypothetical protein
MAPGALSFRNKGEGGGKVAAGQLTFRCVQQPNRGGRKRSAVAAARAGPAHFRRCGTLSCAPGCAPCAPARALRAVRAVAQALRLARRFRGSPLLPLCSVWAENLPVVGSGIRDVRYIFLTRLRETARARRTAARAAMHAPPASCARERPRGAARAPQRRACAR